MTSRRTKLSTRGRVKNVWMRKFVKKVLWRRIRRKMTSRRAKIVNKRTCRGRVDVQSSLERDDL